MRLTDILLGASLFAASGCTCPDGHVETSAFATRPSYSKLIDACVASDANCETLCRSVLELDPATPITKCVITTASPEGAQLDIVYLEPVECGAGRKPTGFHAPRRARGAGAWLASAATLEAASVTAFARLARALAQFEAPAKLVEAVRRAIADELAHAFALGRLARRFGGDVKPPVIDEPPEPALDEVATENAVEGQVGEAFGALVAAGQARDAADDELRAVYAHIAIDEARHAALAHQLARWFERRLGWRQRNAVARARQAAVARVVASCDFGLAADERELLGLPAPDRLRAGALHLFAAM